MARQRSVIDPARGSAWRKRERRPSDRPSETSRRTRTRELAHTTTRILSPSWRSRAALFGQVGRQPGVGEPVRDVEHGEPKARPTWRRSRCEQSPAGAARPVAKRSDSAAATDRVTSSAGRPEDRSRPAIRCAADESDDRRDPTPRPARRLEERASAREPRGTVSPRARADPRRDAEPRARRAACRADSAAGAQDVRRCCRRIRNLADRFRAKTVSASHPRAAPTPGLARAAPHTAPRRTPDG